MRRFVKIAAWTTSALVLLVGLAAAAVYVFATSDYVRAQVENHANALYGRETKIGSISVDWGWTTHIHLVDVQLSNTDWGKAEHMLEAERVDIDIRLWPLLKGDFELPLLRLQKPKIALERNAQGESNWSPEQSPVAGGVAQAVQPEQRSQTPLIGQLEIVDGHVNYVDQKRKLDLDGAIQTATGQVGDNPQAELTLKGKLEGQPLTLHFIGGSALMLRDTDIPYPVDLDVAYGNTKLNAKGTVQDPFKFTGANLQLSLTGQNLADIFPLLGIPGPPTPPYKISGQVTREGDVWKVSDMKLHSGDTDLVGDVTIDQGSKPPHLAAHLVSPDLHVADLAPLIGASPDKKPDAKAGLFPDVPLDLARMKEMDMDVTLEARKVTAPSFVPVDSFKARIQITNGQVAVKPLTVAFGGGTMTGEMTLDGQANPPKLRTNLQFQKVELANFFKGTPFFDTTKAQLQGRIVLAGSGRSLADVMNTADGDIMVTMDGGWISGLMVSLAGLQLGDALILYVTGDNTIPIRCALAHVNLNHGAITFDKALLDTKKSVLRIEGQADLESQAIDVKIEADPKEFDLLDLHAPVLIKGTMSNPKISIDRDIPIPTPEFGGAKDVDCPRLTDELFAGKS